MMPYYQYWEKRIFNAITKMTIRALAANKALWQQREKNLIKMTADYNHPDMTYHPSQEELNTSLSKFYKNIIEASKKFGRWWDGYARIFEERVDNESSEKSIKYTFYTEVNKNPVVRILGMEIVKASKDIIDKFEYYERGYVSKNVKRLFDKGELQKMQKQIEKSQNVKDIEEKIIKFRKTKESQGENTQNQIKNFFILIDYQAVRNALMERCDLWLKVLGNVLSEISSKELKSISNRIQDYDTALQLKMQDSDGINSIKTLLNTISSIRDESMDMELRIIECQEQFRLRQMYQYPVDPEELEIVNALMARWEKLVEDSDKKDFELISYKQEFARKTEQDVEEFKI